jgi:hypothetical protein
MLFLLRKIFYFESNLFEGLGIWRVNYLFMPANDELQDSFEKKYQIPLVSSGAPQVAYLFNIKSAKLT